MGWVVLALLAVDLTELEKAALAHPDPADAHSA